MTASLPTLTDLRVDHLDRPLGLNSEEPRFSWRMEGGLAGHLHQTAYRIEISSSADLLASGQADVWDSGRVASDRTFDVRYGGRRLESRERLQWRVTCWSSEGDSISATSWWEVGLKSSDLWEAGWTAAETEEERRDREADPMWIWSRSSFDEAPRKFRRTFQLTGAATAATLLIAAKDVLLGVWCNGRRVFDNESHETWRRMITIPIDDLRSGSNVLAFEVHTSPVANIPYGGVIALLRAAEPGQEALRLVTDRTWRTCLDAGDNWTTVEFDDFEWEDAVGVLDAPRTGRPTGSQAGQGIATPEWPPATAEIPVSTPRFPPWPPGPAVRLRKAFSVGRSVERARIYATALGCYELTLNGERIGRALMSPELTDTSQRLLYQTYDVTDLVRQGENVIGAVVADGWYASQWSREGRYHFGPAPRRLRLQLEVWDERGERQLVATGPGWRSAPSAILSSEIYNGERYDARAEEPDWDRPGFDPDSWSDAAAADDAGLTIESQPGPPIRRTGALIAEEIRQLANGAWLFDFGQNFSGWCRLRVNGAAGTQVKMRFAEVLDADGGIDQSNLRTAEATDSYILRGDPAGETWEPRFTYHGFRYVEVTGLPDEPTAATLDGIVVHSDLPVTGELQLGEPLLDQFVRNAMWSQRSNFFGMPTDCPQRDERAGWTGDIMVFADAAAFNMNVDGFLRRFMADMRSAQRVWGGVFPDCVPPFNWYYRGGSPGWADAGVVLPWTLWMRYGDTAAIDENWSAMEAWNDWLLSHNPDRLWRNKRNLDFGDWLAVDARYPADATTPGDLIGTAFWARGARMMREMAEATGRNDAAQRYGTLELEIVAAFRSAFVNRDGSIGNGSQTSCILPIAFDLLEPDQRRRAGAVLAADVRRRGMKLSTGFLGTPYILDALADTGHEVEVFGLLAQTAYPSWGYMVKKGATTMWERWNSDTSSVAMNSFNHYAFGAVVGFLYRRIAGLQPIEPGFRRLRIAPLVGELSLRGNARYDSVLGPIATSWDWSDASDLKIDITLPPGSTASVELPARRGVWSANLGSAIPFAPSSTTSDGHATIEIGPGDHRLSLRT